MQERNTSVPGIVATGEYNRFTSHLPYAMLFLLRAHSTWLPDQRWAGILAPLSTKRESASVIAIIGHASGFTLQATIPTQAPVELTASWRLLPPLRKGNAHLWLLVGTIWFLFGAMPLWSNMALLHYSPDMTCPTFIRWLLTQ